MARNERETSLITINQHKRTTTSARGRAQYFLPGLLMIVGAALFLHWSILLSVGLMLLLGIACGITHAEKLKREFNLELYILLILSVAFGSAIVEGGHAQYFIEQIAIPTDASAGIVLLFLLTLLLTNFMTNVSAVAIAFPIAAAMMQHYNLGHLEVFLPVAFGASGSFLTPSSYQTHLMVMGPGNYSNIDFLKLGLLVLVVYSLAAFPNASLVIDRFRVVRLVMDAMQHVRIDQRWNEIDKENGAIQQARSKGARYRPLILSNGDTPKQLLARSRYLLYKLPSQWTQYQLHRVGLLIQLYPSIEKAYQLAWDIRSIYNSHSKEKASQLFQD